MNGTKPSGEETGGVAAAKPPRNARVRARGPSPKGSPRALHGRNSAVRKPDPARRAGARSIGAWPVMVIIGSRRGTNPAGLRKPSRVMGRVRWALASVCAVGVCLLTPGCGGSRHARNVGIVWGSSGQNGGLIRGANVDGSGRHVVATAFGDSEGDPAWSREGKALAFYVRNSDDVKIHVLWPKTRVHRILSSDWRSPSDPKRLFAYLFEPSWAPDGDHLAVSDGWNGPGGSSTIRLVSVATKRWTSLTKPRLYRSDFEPAWSPDGRTIAFARQYYGQNYLPPMIYLVRPSGRGLRRLTPGRSPSWSPDSRGLAFTSGGSIYRIGADGRERSRIIGGVRAFDVRWSPDGRKLLYTTPDGDLFDVWIVNRDGTHRLRVLRKVYTNGVAWRPG